VPDSSGRYSTRVSCQGTVTIHNQDTWHEMFAKDPSTCRASPQLLHCCLHGVLWTLCSPSLALCPDLDFLVHVPVYVSHTLAERMFLCHVTHFEQNEPFEVSLVVEEGEQEAWDQG
jgi:hypothetical protein